MKGGLQVCMQARREGKALTHPADFGQTEGRRFPAKQSAEQHAERAAERQSGRHISEAGIDRPGASKGQVKLHNTSQLAA